MKLILNIDEVAEYLGVNKDTVYNLAPKIPGFKIGNRWRFTAVALEKWIESKMIGVK